MEEEWEVVEEDEEVIGEEEEVVEDEYEAVEDDYEVVEGGVEVVGRPRGDPVLEYVYGFTDEPPASLGEWRFPWMVTEHYKALKLGDKARARRWARLIFRFCPYKPRLCPLYTLTVSRCPVGMERRCRAMARAAARRRPRRWRGWYRRG
ncbi:MAG: hypothetical protein DRJ67_12655 [Thermoprotei archaeon]|nr:MAG: hypothetical protein DRJ67_12655 [Thermoprotei archaeon]